MTNSATRWARAAAWVVLPLLLIGLLRFEGRVWWCACGRFFPWDGDIWSAHNSQHLLDPYSFTHVLHGVLFAGLLHLVFKNAGLRWQLWGALALEGVWEVVENSKFVIQRYREATIGLGYEGDT